MSGKESSEHTENSGNEIDYTIIIRLILKNKLIIYTCLAVGIVSAVLFNTFSSPIYRAYTSFVIPPEGNTGNLNQYSKFLNIQTATSLDHIISNVLNSYTIKLNVAKKTFHFFKDEINERAITEEPKQLSFIIGELKLYDIQFKANSENLLQLIYENEDPKLAQLILVEYLNQLKTLNKDLEISASKQLITIIDPPRLPLGPYKPKKLINLLLGVILSSGLGLSIIFTKEFIHNVLRELKQ